MVDTGFRSSSSSCNRNLHKTNSDEPTSTDHPPPAISSQVEFVDETQPPISKPKESSLRKPEQEIAHLSPSLIPAQQPTISLLSDDSADALSVESLTLVPPVDSYSIHTFSSSVQSSIELEVPKAAAGDRPGGFEPVDTDNIVTFH